MQRIKNTRIISLIIWLIIAVVSVVSMPNLADLVREKGQITLPEDAQSLEAQQLLKEMNENGEENYQIIAVYTSKDGNPLTTEAKEEISSVIAELQKQKQQLGITDILSHLDNEETEKQLTSEDETTILTQISVDQRHGSITKVRDELNEVFDLDQVQTYLTGSDLVSEDFVQSTEKGIQKTEIIAIIFIILVLIVVFRSPIVPFVSLFTVGISYIVSLAIVAHLVNQFNFPFSNFTQVFLIVVLFGIGTDYNILLFTRFKEELGKQDVRSIICNQDDLSNSRKNCFIQWDCCIYWFYGIILGEIWAVPISISGGYWCGSLNIGSNHLKPFLYGCVRKETVLAVQKLYRS